jgi:hypothetical protein
MKTVYDLIESINPATLAPKLLWIDDPHTIYLVKSGGLDIFLQRRDSQGDSGELDSLKQQLSQTTETIHHLNEQISLLQ